VHTLCVTVTLIISIFMGKKRGRLHFWPKYVSC